MQQDMNIKQELIRKSIHIATSVIPIFYLFILNREQIIILCISLFIFFLTADISRIVIPGLKQIYEKIFGPILRTVEKGKKLNGATLLFLGFMISVILFEKQIAIASMFLLSLSDSLAFISRNVFFIGIGIVPYLLRI